MTDILILAPMQGITDHIYRNTHHTHFGTFHEMMAPYILAHGEKAPRPNILKKIFKHNPNDYKLVPQLIGNESKSIVAYINQLFDIGYDEINWNLGCPYEFVTKKKRGSGLLPYPDLISAIIAEILPNIQASFSVKIRLGLIHKDEIYKVIETLNDFPVKEIIIHPRTAEQKYEGKVYLDEFEKYMEITNHQIVYNGDIYTKNDFNYFKKRFPSINRWMIGRGALMNPLLASQIRGIASVNKEERFKKFIKFYNDLYEQYKSRNKKEDARFLNRIKEIWSFQAHSFENPKKVFDSLKNIHSTEQFQNNVSTLHQRFNWIG